MIELIKVDFEPFRMYRGKVEKDEEVQRDVDYHLAKTRQTIN